MGDISINRVSIKDVFQTFQINETRRSFGQLYDELEWNLVDLPKRNKKISMGFFRGKTIVPVWQNRLKEFPSDALTSSKTKSESIEYDVTFSSYDNYFLYPPYYIFDRLDNTYARTSPDVYTSIGTYKGGGRSDFMDDAKKQIVVYGEWIQVAMNVYNVVVKFSITPTFNKLGQAPSELYLIGLDTSNTWVLLLRQDFDKTYSNNSPVFFYVNKLVPCCKYRLICAKTSYKSNADCSTFSLSGMVFFGVTRNDAVPYIRIFWETGVSHTILENVNDTDILGDNLVSRKIIKVECHPKCRSVFYTGVNYTGKSVEISGVTTNTSAYYSSVRIINDTVLDLRFPFNWDGLVYALLFNSIVTFDGNAEVMIDNVRGQVCRFAFGEYNIRINGSYMTPIFSLMFWIKRGDGDLSNILESSELNIHVLGNNMTFKHNGSGATLIDDLENNIDGWTHYCVSYNTGVFKLYRNGVLHKFIDAVRGTTVIESNIMFGKGWKHIIPIKIDNIRVYNVPINPSTLKHVFDFEYFNAIY